MADPITFGALVVALAVAAARRGRDIDDDGSDGNTGVTHVTTQHIDDGVYPLPTIGGRIAVVSDYYQKTATAAHREHLGVDIMYRRLAGEPMTPPRGSKMFYMPPETPVLAALGGKVWSKTLSDMGHSLVIDHGNVDGFGPCCTFYQHMASWARDFRKGDVIAAGEQIGIVGGAVTGYALHHLHFEVWAPVRSKSVNPELFLGRWTRKAT